ncbi:hypothetical protein KO02_21945 [Sphingobacterium sp. ML3W]|uniref:TonB-dependent receptor plug domain-containing protein n=1 Tax=Sphingobacterium sp. ML3W TaxID=1538644 RepID=UPI0004F881D2|nr:TonB-dependent receptor plug domain-containing protein [Sphingobacterium sp. ML3W]AIM39049.1 hypothetical protein KO02_21945 [Sphingobacterium sp. ML3W]
MHYHKILFLALLLVNISVFGQSDSTVVQLDEVILKYINPHKSIYQPQKVSDFIHRTNTGKDLAHHLESLSGVQIRKSGTNVSKPIIDGLSSSRLVYMINGVKLENQDWADAHSPEIDADLANNLSILRGAETVKYGSNALGGVVNVNAGRIPINKEVSGSVTTHYLGNTGGWGGNFKVYQNLSQIKGLRWRLSGNNTQNGDYHTAEYNVTNSGTRLESYQAEIEYELNKVVIKTFYSNYNSKQGNYFGALTGNIEEFEERIELGRPLLTYPYSFNIQAPYQKSVHQIANATAKWTLAPHWFAKAQYTYQKNHREEFDIRRSTSNSVPVQEMILSSTHINSEIEFRKNFLHSALGFQIRNKENFNQPGTGVTPALPNYIYKEKSIYTHHTLLLNHWILNAGLRYDWALMNARGINFLGQTYGENKDFSSLSTQLATKLSTGKWDFNSSLSYGWRVPESYELYANGKQHGIPIYFVGDKKMKAEKGLKWMNTIKYKIKETTLELQGFVNRLNDYIYAIPTHQYKQLFSGPAAIFQFKQQDALIYGLDLIHITDITPKLEFTNKLSWIQGEEVKSKNSLPNISPIRLHNHLSYQFPFFARFDDNSIQISHDWVGKKRNFNPDYELSTQTPSAYNIFNIAISSQYSFDKNLNLRFTGSIDNLFNTLYKDYLNLHRYFVHDRGRSINVNIQFNF